MHQHTRQSCDDRKDLQSTDLAPKMMTTSEWDRAKERAAPTERGCVSDTTPLPMDVLSTGMPALSTNCLIRLSACACAAPLPMTIRGLQNHLT